MNRITLGIVDVRHDAASTKIARRLGGKSLLEWVVRRVTDCQTLDRVVVVLSDSESDRQVAALVPPDVSVFIGKAADALGRFVEAIDAFPCTAVVRVCADNPFIDPVLVDRLARLAAKETGYDYIGYCSRDGMPAIGSPLGVYAEWMPADALRRADCEASPADRQDVTRYLYSNPERFRVRLVRVPSELDRGDVQLRIDDEEDWEHVQAIYEALGPEEWDWQKIAGLLNHQPALRERMAQLNDADLRTLPAD